MRKHFIGLFIIFFIYSCSSQKSTVSLPSVSTAPYQSSGFTKYILPSVPRWASYSQGGDCRINNSVKRLDRAAIEKSFNFSYRQSLFTQWRYNNLLTKKRKEIQVEYLGQSDEEKLFFLAKEAVGSGHVKFFAGKGSPVHIYWIDNIMHDLKAQTLLKERLKASQSESGFHVLFSLCLTLGELEKWSQYAGVNDFVIENISNEMLVTREKNNEVVGLEVNFSKIFIEAKKIHFYGDTWRLPNEVRGFTKYHILK